MKDTSYQALGKPHLRNPRIKLKWFSFLNVQGYPQRIRLQWRPKTMNIERLNLTFGLKCTKGVNDLSGDKKDLKLKGNLKKTNNCNFPTVSSFVGNPVCFCHKYCRVDEDDL